MKKKYVFPQMSIVIISGHQMIAASLLDASQPTNISGITNGGTASTDDEAGVKAHNYSIWDDDWSF